VVGWIAVAERVGFPDSLALIPLTAFGGVNFSSHRDGGMSKRAERVGFPDSLRSFPSLRSAG
jgi:UPF0716 family protein affecting phage T7 exclusion